MLGVLVVLVLLLSVVGIVVSLIVQLFGMGDRGVAAAGLLSG